VSRPFAVFKKPDYSEQKTARFFLAVVPIKSCDKQSFAGMVLFVALGSMFCMLFSV
jgi:hypothetical protein